MQRCRYSTQRRGRTSERTFGKPLLALHFNLQWSTSNIHHLSLSARRNDVACFRRWLIYVGTRWGPPAVAEMVEGFAFSHDLNVGKGNLASFVCKSSRRFLLRFIFEVCSRQDKSTFTHGSRCEAAASSGCCSKYSYNHICDFPHDHLHTATVL